MELYVVCATSRRAYGGLNITCDRNAGTNRSGSGRGILLRDLGFGAILPLIGWGGEESWVPNSRTRITFLHVRTHMSLFGPPSGLKRAQ